VYLPIAQEEATQFVRDEVAIERGHGELVLVVEDEQPLRDLAKLIIEDLGYQTEVTANGGEALILVEEKGLRPDLVLTDVVMPGMSGRVLIERLRRTLPDVKVIYMSGYTDDAVVRHGVLESEINFLQKPFTVSALAAKITSALGGTKKADQ
jgi:two-component system, cell cycle sensor histidine kinase and response regulator CckA